MVRLISTVTIVGALGFAAGCGSGTASPGTSSSGGSSSAAGGSSSAGSGASSAAGTTISLKSLMFMPMTTSVKVGTPVTWTNDEPITHTVTSGSVEGVDAKTGLRSGQKPDGMFNAKLAGKGDTFTFTFTKPGKYSYYCDIHEGMNAVIDVTS